MIVVITILWLIYGTFNAWQHKFYSTYAKPKGSIFWSSLNVLFAPIALFIRVIRGVFIWKGY